MNKTQTTIVGTLWAVNYYLYQLPEAVTAIPNIAPIIQYVSLGIVLWTGKRLLS